MSFVLISIMPSTLLSILPCLYSVNYFILRWKLFFEYLVFHAYKTKLLLQLEILFFTGGDYALSSSALSYMLACIASRFNYGLAFVDDIDFEVQFASFSFLIALLYLCKRRRLQCEVTDTMLIFQIVQINGKKPKR